MFFILKQNLTHFTKIDKQVILHKYLNITILILLVCSDISAGVGVINVREREREREYPKKTPIYKRPIGMLINLQRWG